MTVDTSDWSDDDWTAFHVKVAQKRARQARIRRFWRKLLGG